MFDAKLASLSATETAQPQNQNAKACRLLSDILLTISCRKPDIFLMQSSVNREGKGSNGEIIESNSFISLFCGNQTFRLTPLIAAINGSI